MVYDLIYNPPETLFLRRARKAGLEILGGVEMFVAQGAAQFRLYTGREAPIEVMRRAVDRALAGAPS
jgi:shikimate 5-dehydrogenase